jgi:MOSC domain-containing protein YiiM
MGTLEQIWIKSSSGGPMDAADSAELVTGRGIIGNANQGGHRQVTIIEKELWEAMMRELESDLPGSMRRANFMVSGLSLLESRGRSLQIGECMIEIRGETKPCRLMEELLPGLQDAMRRDWRGGAYGVITRGGRIQVGDSARFVTR